MQIRSFVRVSDRGRITVPKTLRERFGLDRNVEVEFIPTEQGLLIRKSLAAAHPVDRVAGILDSGALGEGVSVDDYIEEIRGR